MSEVALHRLAKVFPNGVEAVREVTLTVADGELVVLLGPSGCGKTTTLRLIAGLEEATSGTISIGGQIVNSLPPRKRNVAMVFQKSTLYPHLSVRRNIGFGLELRQRPHAMARLLARWLGSRGQERIKSQETGLAERVDHTARLLGLEDVLDRRPSQLSGGQQQRVALGRAIAREPEVFLLDEPLSQLDGQLRAELRHELHLLQRRLHKTMIYVTHDQAEAMTLADRLVVMDHGAVQQVDRPQVVYEQPHSRFVAGFLGWPAMNFIDGKLIQYEGRISFEGSGLRLAVPQPKSEGWAAHVGRAVTLGVRPEDVQPGSGEGALGMSVVLLESLGPERLATVERNGLRMTAKVSGRLGIENRQTVEVCLHMEHAHLFDRESGLALNPGRPAG
jgi:multiple sugar transport system ATP-binding protein